MGRGGGSSDYEEYAKPICCVCSTVMLVIIILISSSFNAVNFDEWALASSAFSKRVFLESDGSARVYDSGLYGTGLGVEFIRFKKTLHHIDFVNTGDEEEGDVGGAAARVDGPVTIRTVDGQILDIEISLQYRLSKDKLYELYKEYGTEYNSFFLAIVRSTIRDAASKNTATRFFADRADLEREFSEAVNSEFVKRNSILMDLQLRGVVLPTTLESTVEDIQLNKLEQTLKATELTTAKIRANTTLRVKKVTANTNLFLTKYSTETENLRLKETLTAVQYEQDTMVQIAGQGQEIQRDTNIVNANTANVVEEINGNISVANSETNRIVTNYTYKRYILERNFQKLRADLESNASATAVIALANGTANAVASKAAKYKEVFQKFKGTNNMDAETVNLLEWTEFFRNIRDEGLRMDVAAPTKLFLQGQEAALKENLKSKGGPQL